MTKNLVKFYPNMTSDTSPYMTTSSQLYDSLRLPYMAFDGTSSYWASKTVSGWLKIDFLENKKLSNIYIKGDATPRYSIKDFTIEVSNDDIIWETIQTVTNVSWASSEVKVFSISLAEKGYRYYKINITDNNSGLYSRIVDIYFDELMPINKTLILHDGEYKKMVVETKATPIMTSSTTPSGIVTQSSSFSEAYDGWKIFSEDLYDASGWNTPYNVSSGWVSYKFESPVTIVEYNLRPRYNAPSPDSNNILQMANTWNLEGSNDGIDWIILDYQTGHTWKQGEVKGFKVQSIGSYFYYRLNVLSNNVTSYGVAIGRLNLFQDNGWLKVSSTLPTQQQFQSDGMNSISPLLDRKVTTLQPMEMQSKSDILPVGSDGRVFSRIVDLNKYIDIRSMKVEVE